MLLKKVFMHIIRKPAYAIIIALFVALAGIGILVAQDSAPLSETPDCDPATLAQQQTTLATLLTLDFEVDPERARDNLFRLGAAYQALALQCGYEPSSTEVDAMVQQVLLVATMADIIVANSVGSDVEAILTELGDVRGDLSNGQLLYNGAENGLDGTPLGCSGCHSTETAPPTEGTWTRADEIRLQDAALADYDIRRYLVESIVEPNKYIVPDYQPNLMPANYSTRLDIQMLADIVAYLDSQDQLLED